MSIIFEQKKLLESWSLIRENIFENFTQK